MGIDKIKRVIERGRKPQYQIDGDDDLELTIAENGTHLD